MIAIRLIYVIIGMTVLFSSCQKPKGKELYTLHCAGCHGMQLQGTTSGSELLNSLWKNEAGEAYITSRIKFGIPNSTMIGWETILTEKEITAISKYIVAFQQDRDSHEVKTGTEKVKTKTYRLQVEKLVIDHLATPWAIEFLNADSALISEKPGSLKWFVNGELDQTPIAGLPKPHTASFTGGYMDIALDPDFESNRWIYLAYSETFGAVDDKDAPGMTKIVRGKITENQWQEEQTLFQMPDSLHLIHGDRWGCRLIFDQEGSLYFTIGDMGRDKDSQKLNKPTGKVFRINPDGSIPDDNPFITTPGALPAIYTLGNRNTQGLTINPKTGEIWSTDHGPRGGDELNILHKGANYGWPVVTFGIDYSGEIISDKTYQEGMEPPVVQWTPSIAVCPATFIQSPLFPKWENDLLVGALAFQEIRLLDVVGDEVVQQEIIIKGMGRIRDLKFGPDGALYVLTNSPDRLLRITPDEQKSIFS